jgi:hypothetical protein
MTIFATAAASTPANPLWLERRSGATRPWVLHVGKRQLIAEHLDELVEAEPAALAVLAQSPDLEPRQRRTLQGLCRLYTGGAAE